MKPKTFSLTTNKKFILDSIVAELNKDPHNKTMANRLLAEIYNTPDITGYEKYVEIILDNEYIDPSIISYKILLYSYNIVVNDEKNAPNVFIKLMKKNLIKHPILEKKLVGSRKNILQELLATNSTSYSEEYINALSHQCFLNEYIYYAEPTEISNLILFIKNTFLLAIKLQMLDKKTRLCLLIASCYIPIHEINNEYPQIISLCKKNNFALDIIKEQLDNFLIEQKIKTSIKSLSNIQDNISKGVQAQYEKNPYPRWNAIDILPPEKNEAMMFNNKFNLGLDFSTKKRILIAGCGTGKHALAKWHPNMDMTAIDLSKSSLAYAIRRANELGIFDINWMQADILNLGKFDEKFDIIESVGVLHHTRSIEEAFSKLYPLLNTGGLFYLGLYSTKAREPLVQAREKIKELGLSNNTQDIRYLRHMYLSMHNDPVFKDVITFGDFYSTSMFIDLLLHYQEITVDIIFLKYLLDKFNMKFITFVFIDLSETPKLYNKEYPTDPLQQNLDNWHEFEQKYPETFRGMYQLVLQKK